MVLLLDQLAKLTIHLGQLAGAFQFGSLQITILKASAISTAPIEAALLDSNTWLLIGGAVLLGLSLIRWNAAFYFISLRAVVGLQLAVGGILTYAFDYLLRGAPHGTVALQLADSFTLKLGIAEIALTVSFLLLIHVLSSGATHIKSRLPLRHANRVGIHLTTLPRGFDNIHIDVQLSPAFCQRGTSLIKSLVDAEIHSVRQKRPSSPPEKQLAAFREAFLSLHKEAVLKAKGSGTPPLLDLFYLTLFKFIHNEVSNQVAARVRQAKEDGPPDTKKHRDSSEYHRFVRELFRQQEDIKARVNLQLFTMLLNDQRKRLSHMVKGILGNSHVFAMEALRAPLLLANSGDSETVQHEHYLLFGQGKHSQMGFMEMERALSEALRDCLRFQLLGEELEHGPAMGQATQGNNTIAAMLSRPSVLVHHDNTTILFDQQWTRRKLADSQPLKQWRRYYKYYSHRRFQSRLAERVIQHLGKAGLLRWVAAVYEARAILKTATAPMSLMNMVTLLFESTTRKELHKRLAPYSQIAAIQAQQSTILKRWVKIHKQPALLVKQHLLELMTDFSHFRHDLQLQFQYQRAVNEIRLLTDEKSIQASRANYVLNEFLLPNEKKTSQARISAHIIIKADLRGSTEVTDRLNQLGLNPAGHFDRNFFTPINQAVKEFEVEKVFIEGDAIILILNDYAGTTHEQLIASCACALAARILEIVAKQNKELLCYNLPPLELGIGIAHSDTAPHYLYDGEHKITISPAINRADRLSACAWSIRNWRARQNAHASHVEVYQPSKNALAHGEKAQTDMVYNHNGILIEEAVFQMLSKELSLKRIGNTLPQLSGSKLYAIKVPWLSSATHSLVIRKAPLQIYDPDYPVDDCPTVDGRYFYEVIHDRTILERLRKRRRPERQA